MCAVKHGKRLYKQMALEVAVRNPERYDDILKTFSKFRGTVLDDEGILDIFAALYSDGVVTTKDIDVATSSESEIKSFIRTTITHNNEWGFPTGYQAGFTRYLKTLSEFGFIYSQYNQPLRLSEVAEAVINGTISLSEAFAVQSLRFWRKSPYRRVLNDFNFFTFIIDVIRRRNESGHKLSYPQFMLALFSDNGDVDAFLNLIEENRFGNSFDDTYNLVLQKYHLIDADHAKVCKQQSAFNDYGNTVFRVLQLTGFITVEYQGVIMLSVNSNRMRFYDELCAMQFSVPETAKEDYNEYFEVLGKMTTSILRCIQSNRDIQQRSVDSYNDKLSNIVADYHLTEEILAEYLMEVSNGSKDRRAFWFMQVPLKFEFLLSLYLFVCFGEEYEYKPNYICDDAGIPYSHAPGNIGDIEVFNRDFYWLIEATLIKSKNQQMNAETINLFRHIDNSRSCTKYLSLVAPYIHEDTDLMIKVATVVTMLEQQSLIFSKPYNTENYISHMHKRDIIDDMQRQTLEFVGKLGRMLNGMHETYNLIK